MIEILRLIEKYSNNRRAVSNIQWDIKAVFGDAILFDILTIKAKTFTESLFLYINEYKSPPPCLYCNSSPRRFKNLFDGYDETCSRRCKNLYLYGVDNPAKLQSTKNKTKLTNIIRYGGATPLYSSAVLSRGKETSLRKYGVDHFSKTGKHLDSYRSRTGFSSPLANPTIRNSINNTNIIKYGGKSPMASDKIRKKVSNSRLGKKYTCGLGQRIAFFNRMKDIYSPIIDFIFSVDDYIGTHQGTTYARYNFKCKRCDTEFCDFFDHSGIRCPKCDRSEASSPQAELAEFIQNLGFSIDTNNRTIIAPLELDIYIPEKKLAIEYNGLRWHSEDFGNKDKNYHINKTTQCADQQIRLIHIFEDEWKFSKTIVKSRLKAILGISENKIYARNCKVSKISSIVKREFLMAHHIQGNCKSTFNIGAFHGEELIAVMTFGKRRFDRRSGYELLRFTSKTNFSVVGIASKLLKYAEENYINDVLISYCDIRWGTGTVYHKLGFSHIRNTPPNYFYINRDIRMPRQKFQKHKLSAILTNVNLDLSEHQNMLINGYERIWDCGNMVFEKTYQ